MIQELQNPREARGLQIAQSGGIKQIDLNLYKVPAQGGSGTYTVDFRNFDGKCDCPDCQTRHIKCKHQFAVEYFLKFEKDLQGNMTVTQVKRTTYPQNWKAYNKAQINEVELFDKLLRDLVGSVEEPLHEGRGRPPLSMQDSFFCAIQKVYSQLSSRRAHSLYRSAKGKEQITKAPNFNAINKFLNQEEIVETLHELLKLSALPLKSVEKDFAIDSSGFRTTQFNEYCREKHKTKKKHQWLKAHVMVGVKTNVITGAEITNAYGADCPQFEPLVRKTHDSGFSMNEVSADKAYLSRANLGLVDELGATAYIPFKENSRGQRTRGGSPIWKKMFYLFQYRNDEFMEHYHKRSNVETVFQMVKAKFGETLKSKKLIAQKNELLCKLIAHNVVVFIHEMQELGIKADFTSNS